MHALQLRQPEVVRDTLLSVGWLLMGYSLLFAWQRHLESPVEIWVMLGLVLLWSLSENCSVHAAQINLTHVPGWSLQDTVGFVSLEYRVKPAGTLLGHFWPAGMLVMMIYLTGLCSFCLHFCSCCSECYMCHWHINKSDIFLLSLVFYESLK